MFETLEDFLKWKPPTFIETISSGLLPVGGKLALFGAEGTMKTMLTTYACLCVSNGLPFLGFKTKQTRTGLLQAEVTKAMFHKRMSKLAASFNGQVLNRREIMLTTELDLKLNKPHGLAQLINGVKEDKVGFLAVDPLYKVLQGDISDWGEGMKLLDGLDYIARTFNCSIWLVHHSRKQHISSEGKIVDAGTDEAIGFSGLKNWADTMIKITDLSDDLFRLDFLKVRNAEETIRSFEVKFDRSTLKFSLAGV